MEEDLFKRFYDERLGVSFFYNSLLTREKNSLSTTYNENDDLQLKYDEMKFRIIKLSSKANVGLQLFGLENGLRSSLNENETITEELEPRYNKVAGNETAITTTVYPTPEGHFKIRRYLVSHNGQGYLLAFQNRAEKFESKECQRTIQTILDTFRFLE